MLCQGKKVVEITKTLFDDSKFLKLNAIDIFKNRSSAQNRIKKNI